MIFLLVLVVVLVVGAEGILEDMELFGKWKEKYQKLYSSEEEDQRFLTFQLNMVRARELNEKEPNAVFGDSPFMDLTDEEFALTHLMKPVSKEELGTFGTTEDLRDSSCPTTPLAEYDLRKEGKVTPVKNQLQCGSCWTFGTTASAESAYAKKYNTLVSFSEQQILDCSRKGSGCSGGTHYDAMSYVMEYGLEKDIVYPYVGYEKTCSYNSGGFIANFSGFKILDDLPNAVENIKCALVNAGAVAVGYDASGVSFQYYSGGILSGNDCSKSIFEMNHASAIVGYGLDDSASPKMYWIVKNSWDSVWGEGGYFKIYAGSNPCGMEGYYGWMW